MNAYLRVLRAPRLGPLLAATLLARLPIGINGLAVVLFLRDQGESFAVAGAAAGGLALGMGLGSPFNARLVDRFGARVLLLDAVAHATGLVALLLLGSAGAPPAVLVAAAALAGGSLPPTSSVMRSLYPRLLAHDDSLLQTAFATDSVLTETIFIVGPLLTAATMALVDAGAALVLSGAVVVAGAATFVALLPHGAVTGRGAPSPHGRLGALRSPGIRTLIVAMVPVGIGLGAIEVALPAFADHEGRRELAGLLIAIWSIGSAAGGLVYGARPRRGSLADAHLRAALLVPVGFAALTLATSLPTMAVLVIPAGLAIAPLIATRNELAGDVAPDGVEAEAYSWPITALVGGVALGAGLSGAIADAHDWRAAVVLAAASAALGALIAVLRRDTLAPPRPASTARPARAHASR